MRYNIIINKHEWFSLLWLSLVAAVWSAGFLVNMDSIPKYFYIASILLLSGFAYYILNLLRDHSKKPGYTKLLNITGIVLGIIVMGVYLFDPDGWWQQLLTVAIILLYGLFSFLFVRNFVSKSGRYYRVIAAAITCAAGLIVLATIGVLISEIPNPFFCQLGVMLLILTAGANTLDRSNLIDLQDLNLQLHQVKQQFENENENIEDVVISLARTIDAKDKYTEGHIERVSQYAIFLGERIGLDETTLETIRIGALIHDIGKICIDLNILNKPGKLTANEFQQIKQHPLLGEQICYPLKALRDAGVIVRSHHEKLDGSGYPDGLYGDAISIETRIVTIADIFDALTTERSYRNAITVQEAIFIMRKEAKEGKLDIVLVDEFFDMLAEMEIFAQQYIV